MKPAPQECWHIWIDTGGTFTDCVALAPDGSPRRAKVLSSGKLRFAVEHVDDEQTIALAGPWPSVPNLMAGWSLQPRDGQGAVPIASFDAEQGLVHLAAPLERRLKSGDPVDVHSPEDAPVLAARIVTSTAPGSEFPPIRMRLATTRGTNALLERRGHPPVLFITKGFGDLLEIGTQARPELFARDIIKPRPLYACTVEVDERLTAQGTVLRPLNEAQLRESARRLVIEGHTVAAVAFMHSYLNPVHELRVAEILMEEGFEVVRTSASLAPLIRLLPRAQTTVVDAYLSPIISETIRRVREGIGGEKLQSLHLMTSAGGLSRDGRYHPKDSLLSGPAGGVVAIAAAARGTGLGKVIGFDMGGTSTDVARWDGAFGYVFEHRIGDATLVAPALAIESVAAGGGSICKFAEGRLQVGPESGGAQPGPACYGAGGPLTITDVNLLMGRLATGSFEIPLNRDAAVEALQALRDELQSSTGEHASEEAILNGLLAIANERMAGAIRQVSIAQGYDPAEYALVAFGGAGGQHACAIAELLGIGRILVPADASVLSAVGLGQAAIERIAERQVLLTIRGSELEALMRMAGELESEARRELEEEGLKPEQVSRKRIICSMRYVGQDATLPIDWDGRSNPAINFEARYAEVFAYTPTGRAIELESMRVVVATEAESRDVAMPVEPVAFKSTVSQRCHTGGEWRNVPVRRQEALSVGMKINGPALIVGRSTVTLVDVKWVAEPNEQGGLLLARSHTP
jgi:5-oxoprolinase (ATP-hydrolysing)